GHNRTEIHWIEVDFVTEASHDIRGDDTNTLLWKAGNPGKDGAMHVRRLRGQTYGKFPRRRVIVRDTATGFNRCWMDAWNVDVLLDDDAVDRSVGKSGIGR